MAVAGARTDSVGGVVFGAVAVWSEIEVVHQSVDCGSVFGGGWHLVRSARLLLVYVCLWDGE
jgi:hypothetical protein